MYKVNKKIVVSIALTALLVLPLIALAISPGEINYPNPINKAGLLKAAGNILNFIWTLFCIFAAIMFLIAGFLFLSANGDPSKVKEAKQAFLWGVVGVLVGIIGFSGIVDIILGLLF